MNLEQVFVEYERIADELYDTVWDYSMCFHELEVQVLEESVLDEKVKEREEQEIRKEILNLEKRIQSLFVDFLNHTNILLRALEKGGIFNLEAVNRLNKRHIRVMTQYDNIIEQFEDLKEDFPNYDFDSVIDFSKMEKQKMKLNIAIKKFNINFLPSENIRLLDVFECSKEVFQRKQRRLNSKVNSL